MQFYVMSEGKKEPVGPFDVSTIVEHIGKGWLNSNSTICKPGDSTWLSISQVPEFAIALSKGAREQPLPAKKPAPQKPVPKWATWAALGTVGLVVAMCSLGRQSSEEEGARDAQQATLKGETVDKGEAVQAPDKEESPKPTQGGVEPAVPIDEAFAKFVSLPASQDQLRQAFEKMDIVFEKSTPVGDKPRIHGKHPNGVTMIEVIGRRGEAESATVMVGLVPDAAIVNTAVIMVFMREFGWSEGHEWAIDSLKTEKAEKVQRGVRFTVQNLESIGIATLNAKPASAE